MNAVTVDTPYGPVTGNWQIVRGMIELSYGERVRRAQASDNHATNRMVATNLLRNLIAEDLRTD